MTKLKSPFPWFGGKSRVCDIVWTYFGDTYNYVEPFFGSGAVLLGRPSTPRAETVNDKDAMVANFWRCFSELRNDPDSPAWEQVAQWADWPVNEADLHARHLWLVNQKEFQERMKTDPDYYDAKVAGWWVWGISQWIGGGWCVNPEWRGRYEVSKGKGIHRKRMNLKRSGVGVHRQVWKQRPSMVPNGVHRQLPDISGESGAYGRGVHRCGLESLLDYFQAIADRMRRVRVCCGDWKRIMGPSPTYKIGTTAVFLDPPYAHKTDDGKQNRDKDLYAVESSDVAAEVRDWAIANGDNPLLRICLCGYEDEHISKIPKNWTMVSWEANGGYANQHGGPGTENAKKERLWFSPHCLKPATRVQIGLL